MPRIVVASNRLPVTLHPNRPEHDGGEVAESSGGLVSAFRRVAAEQELVWIGWPGCSVSSEVEQHRLTKLLADRPSAIKLVPVWLPQSDVEEFYNGFSNSSLWPLLHWMTPYARFKRAWADSYRRVNEKFADVILSVATPDDLIWIQDYHLFLVPQLLRKKRDSDALQDELAKCNYVQAVDDRGRPQKHQAAIRLEGLAEETDEEMRLVRPCFLPPQSGDVDADSEGIGNGGTHDAANGLAQRLSNSHDDGVAFRSPRSEAGECGTSSKNGAVHAFSPLERPRPGASVGAGHRLARSITEIEQDTKLKIAFFLHTPFPPHEVISVLPQCQDIVEGLLGADLVGFHTYSYLRHYRSCVVRLCGLTPEIDHIDHRGQRTRLGVFPIGANWQDIGEAMKSEQFTDHLEEYTKQFQGKSLVLSVERLDYSKGIPQRLDAIQRYLEVAHSKAKNKEAEAETSEERLELLEDLQKRFKDRQNGTKHGTWRSLGSSFKQLLKLANQKEKELLDHTKTVFLFIAVPSRQNVEEYRLIEEQVHRTISTINGRFSTPTHQPIVYIHRSVKMEELAALYARADCCLVTPLIDGMNLVAKEYVAAKDRQVPNVAPGILVLSELAGAAQELFDAIVVNPYDEDAVADAIAVGLELVRGGHLEEDLQWEVTSRMREHVMQNDAVNWAKSLLADLQEPLVSPVARPQDKLMLPLRDSVALHFFRTNPGEKALFLDYDGTLREFMKTPEEAVPCADSLKILQDLDKREDLHIYIVSGRTKDFLKEHFAAYQSFTLVAEHGYLKHGPDTGGEWRSCSPYACTMWMEKVQPIMQLYARCTPGARVESKATSIVWHYRECDDEYGQFKAKELMHQLVQSLGNLPCRISQGHKIIEVASLEVKKGLIVASTCREREAAGHPFAEVLCIGDDQTDESMFVDAPETAWTVKVGPGDSYARHRLETPLQVRRFLSLIVAERLPEQATASGHSKSSTSRGNPSVDDEKDSPRFKSCEIRRGDSAHFADAEEFPNVLRFTSCENRRTRSADHEEDDEENPLDSLGDCEEPSTS